jgi:hypothetical protein
MKSNTISNMISKIQFAIYSFFAFIFSTSVILYALLSYGISVESIVLPQFKVEKLYIKLDKKLIFHAKRIDVSLGDTEEETSSLEKNLRLHPLINFVRKIFQSFVIEELNIDTIRVTFSYKDAAQSKEENSLRITSDEIEAVVNYRVYDDFFIVDMPRFRHKPSNISIRSHAVVDFKDAINYAHFTLSVGNAADIELYAKEDGNALAFTASSDVIADLAPVVDLFGLKKGISKWIVENNKAAGYQLLLAKGIYVYRDPQKILDTLFLHAQEKDVAYTFNESLSPLRAKEADAYFSKNLLTISSKEPSYNDHIVNNGQVKIDFSNAQTRLEVDLTTKTRLEQDIIDIVNAYNIPLPLLQKSGITDAHLKIDINLKTEEASASGEFFIKDSDIIFAGVDTNIKNAAIRLHKNYLSIDTADVTYQKTLSAKLNGNIDLHELTGTFFFDIEKLELALSEQIQLKLLSPATRLQLQFSKNSQTLSFAKTRWALDEQILTLDANRLFFPLKFSSKAYIIEPLILHAENLADAKINGSFDPKEGLADLDINLSNLFYKGKELEFSTKEKRLALTLKHEQNETRLSLPTETTFMLNKHRIVLKPAQLRFSDVYAELNSTEIAFDDDFSAQISMRHRLGSQKAIFQLKKSRFVSEKYLYIEPSFELLYEKRLDEHYLDINTYAVHAIIDKEGNLELNAKKFSKIYPYSGLMQRYDIKAGRANVTLIGEHLGLDIQIKDFHPLLSENNKEVREYTIKGDYQNKTATLRINDQLDLVYREKGRVTASNLEFNLFPIRDYLKFINNREEKGNLQLKVKTKACSIILGDSQRKIISDSIDIDINSSSIHAELIYKKGGILFESQGNDFSVFGRELDDTFMNKLFKFSTFKGGVLSFMGEGNFDQFEGVMRINNTTIKDYTVLNNALAFFNTIPSLVTFSVPGYSKKGLKVSEMYSQFVYDNNKIFIKGTKIDSKELTITAEGESDLDKDSIDLLMEVKTEIGSAAKNIPLIGYIIFGDETVSTTVRVHGDLSDPKVESAVAKSIIVAPYNIIKRTITLPFKIFDLFESDESNTSKE